MTDSTLTPEQIAKIVAAANASPPVSDEGMRRLAAIRRAQLKQLRRTS
jgi:hypothetical protein